MENDNPNRPLKVLILGIVPSPYQRDLFCELAKVPNLSIEVFYAQKNLKHSPFPEVELQPFERILKGFTFYWKAHDFTFNWSFPSLEGVDAVVVNGYYTLLGQWGLRVASKKVPVIFWGEKMIGSDKGIRGRVFRFLTKPIRKVSAFVAIGKGASRDYGQRYPGKPVYELPYLCDIKAFMAANPNRPRQPIKIIFCGQMIHRKGVDLLLDAFSRLIGEGMDLRLQLVGWEAELPGMLKVVSPEVRAKIEFMGFHPPEALPGFFAGADIFVLPSRYDGWGVVVNQALGAGLPVVCSDAVGSAEDLVEPGGNGFIFPSGDVDKLTESLRTLAGDPGLISQYSIKSRLKAENLAPEKGALKWYQILDEVSVSWGESK